MNQSQSRTIRYAVAGLCGLVLLLVIDWLVLREPPPSSDQPPVRAATAAPRTRPATPLFTPDDDARHETPTTEVTASPMTNAATLYRQAFALLDAIPREDGALFDNWRTNGDPSVEAELCEKIQPACELVYQAAALTNCDWELRADSPDGLLSDLSKSRAMARAMVWTAAHCRTTDLARAVDDLVATSRLGQNLSPVLIGHLVDIAIQNMLLEFVTAHTSTLSDPGDTRLVQLFAGAQFKQRLVRAIEQEADMLSKSADEFAAMPPEEAMHKLEPRVGSPPSIEFSQAIADIRQAGELVRECGRALELSEEEFRVQLARLQAVAKTNPFNELLYVEKTVDKTQAITIKFAMAAAGLAVMQGGPDALRSHPDPATGQPFVYTQSADGFELQSGYQVDEQPLKLRFK